MEDGLVGALVLRHVESVVVFLGEGDGTRHDGARAELAGDPHGEAVAVLLPAVDRAHAARIGHVLRRHLDDPAPAFEAVPKISTELSRSLYSFRALLSGSGRAGYNFP